MAKFQASSVRKGYCRVYFCFFFMSFYQYKNHILKIIPFMGRLHTQKRQKCNNFSPSQRKVKESQELSQGGLIHHIYHAHFCDQEVQNTAPGCNWKHRKTQICNRRKCLSIWKPWISGLDFWKRDLTQNSVTHSGQGILKCRTQAKSLFLEDSLFIELTGGECRHNVVYAVQAARSVQTCTLQSKQPVHKRMDAAASSTDQGSAVSLHLKGKGLFWRLLFKHPGQRRQLVWKRQKRGHPCQTGVTVPWDNFTPIHILRALRASSDMTTMTLIMADPSVVKVEMTKPLVDRWNSFKKVSSALWYCHTSPNQNIILEIIIL